MIVVTGAAGFIGSNLIQRLNQDNYKAIIAVDKFNNEVKNKNLAGMKIKERIDRDFFLNWLDMNYETVEFIFHLGARTDTDEVNLDLLRSLNTEYSKEIWRRCCKYQLPLVYASSAGTYGSGEFGYDDDESKIPLLKPLDPYSVSKQEFDVWALQQLEKPFFWAGLKFFNVYGPNEYHKGRMASVVWHAYNQISQTGKMKLFKSYNPHYNDGEQKRDFIYVKDVAEVCVFFMHHRKISGIYNVGSGKARTYNDVATAVFNALNKSVNIKYIDTPHDIRDKYQYFTKARMEKLRGVGYSSKVVSLDEGISDYIVNYLTKKIIQ